MDQHLAGGGLLRGRVHEVVGVGRSRDWDDGAALGFALALIRRIGAQVPGPILWCAARPELDGHGLAGLGLDPGRFLIVRAAEGDRCLWALEEGLRCPGLAVAVAELGSAIDLTQGRRLQLAAEACGVTGLVLRCVRSDEATPPSAVETRWRVTSALSADMSVLASHPHPNPPPSRGRESLFIPSPLRGGGSGRGVGSKMSPAMAPRWRVQLEKSRGGRPGEWTMEWCDATGDFGVVAAVRDRSAGAEERRRAV